MTNDLISNKSVNGNEADSFVHPCFSFRNRIARFLWNIVYQILFKTSPTPFFIWRRFLLRIFGGKISREARIYPSVVIWAPWNLVMLGQSGMGPRVNCYNMALITLHHRSVVSQGAHLCCGTHDYNDPNFRLIARQITIMPLAWLSTECFIGPGVTIGEGAIVGARSVTVRDVKPWQIVAGNPAKFIKDRDRSKTVVPA